MENFEAYENLANAIVVNAIEDYVEAIVDKHDAEEALRKAESEIIDVEKFLESDWYKMLTKVEAQALVDVAHKQAFYIIWQKNRGCLTCKHKECEHKVRKVNWQAWANGSRTCLKDKNWKDERRKAQCSESDE